MKFSALCLPVLAVSLLCSTTSCQLRPGNYAADKMAVVPPEFLLTRYTPLNNWLDTKVRVQIFDVPLSRITQEPALRGIRYRLVQAPEENPLIFIDKLAMTRRQLLWSLAQDHQLHLTPVFNEYDGTACIEIRSRAARNEERSRGL